MPVHFTRVSLEAINIFAFEDIESWIEEHTQGRYAVCSYPVNQGSKLVSKTYAGFENPVEATYFSLSYLSNQKSWWS